MHCSRISKTNQVPVLAHMCSAVDHGSIWNFVQQRIGKSVESSASPASASSESGKQETEKFGGGKIKNSFCAENENARKQVKTNMPCQHTTSPDHDIPLARRRHEFDDLPVQQNLG